MKIHHEELSDVARYVEKYKDVRLEDKEPQFEAMFRRIGRFKALDRDTRMLEIGTGTGWIPILCAVKGLHCRWLEISPRLVEFARDLGRRYGVEP
ncbi:MAG: hypothetical protein AB1742_09085 [bacterium]